jgi:hypothetical protein
MGSESSITLLDSGEEEEEEEEEAYRVLCK